MSGINGNNPLAPGLQAKSTAVQRPAEELTLTVSPLPGHSSNPDSAVSMTPSGGASLQVDLQRQERNVALRDAYLTAKFGFDSAQLQHFKQSEQLQDKLLKPLIVRGFKELQGKYEDYHAGKATFGDYQNELAKFEKTIDGLDYLTSFIGSDVLYLPEDVKSPLSGLKPASKDGIDPQKISVTELLLFSNYQRGQTQNYDDVLFGSKSTPAAQFFDDAHKGYKKFLHDIFVLQTGPDDPTLRQNFFDANKPILNLFLGDKQENKAALKAIILEQMPKLPENQRTYYWQLLYSIGDDLSKLKLMAISFAIVARYSPFSDEQLKGIGDRLALLSQSIHRAPAQELRPLLEARTQLYTRITDEVKKEGKSLDAALSEHAAELKSVGWGTAANVRLLFARDQMEQAEKSDFSHRVGQQASSADRDAALVNRFGFSSAELPKFYQAQSAALQSDQLRLDRQLEHVQSQPGVDAFRDYRQLIQTSSMLDRFIGDRVVYLSASGKPFSDMAVVGPQGITPEKLTLNEVKFFADYALGVHRTYDDVMFSDTVDHTLPKLVDNWKTGMEKFRSECSAMLASGRPDSIKQSFLEGHATLIKWMVGDRINAIPDLDGKINALMQAVIARQQFAAPGQGDRLLLNFLAGAQGRSIEGPADKPTWKTQADPSAAKLIAAQEMMIDKIFLSLPKRALVTQDEGILSAIFVNPRDQDLTLKRDFLNLPEFQQLPEQDKVTIAAAISSAQPGYKQRIEARITAYQDALQPLGLTRHQVWAHYYERAIKVTEHNTDQRTKLEQDKAHPVEVAPPPTITTSSSIPSEKLSNGVEVSLSRKDFIGKIYNAQHTPQALSDLANLYILNQYPDQIFTKKEFSEEFDRQKTALLATVPDANKPDFEAALSAIHADQIPAYQPINRAEVAAFVDANSEAMRKIFVDVNAPQLVLRPELSPTEIMKSLGAQPEQTLHVVFFRAVYQRNLWNTINANVKPTFEQKLNSLQTEIVEKNGEFSKFMEKALTSGGRLFLKGPADLANASGYMDQLAALDTQYGSHLVKLVSKSDGLNIYEISGQRLILCDTTKASAVAKSDELMQVPVAPRYPELYLVSTSDKMLDGQLVNVGTDNTLLTQLATVLTTLPAATGLPYLPKEKAGDMASIAHAFKNYTKDHMAGVGFSSLSRDDKTSNLYLAGVKYKDVNSATLSNLDITKLKYFMITPELIALMQNQSTQGDPGGAMTAQKSPGNSQDPKLDPANVSGREEKPLETGWRVLKQTVAIEHADHTPAKTPEVPAWRMMALKLTYLEDRHPELAQAIREYRAAQQMDPSALMPEPVKTAMAGMTELDLGFVSWVLERFVDPSLVKDNRITGYLNQLLGAVPLELPAVEGDSSLSSRKLNGSELLSILQGYQAQTALPEGGSVGRIVRDLKDPSKAKDLVFLTVFNYLLNGVDIMLNGRAEIKNSHVDYDTLVVKSKGLMTGAVPPAHLGALLKSDLLKYISPDTLEYNKISLSLMGEQMDRLDSMAINVLADQVLSAGRGSLDPVRDVPLAISKASRLREIAHDLGTNSILYLNDTTSDPRLQDIIDAKNYLKNIVLNTFKPPTIDQKPQSDMGKSFTDILLTNVKAIPGALVQPLTTAWDFNIGFGTSMTQLQLQTFHNMNNYKFGSDMEIATDGNGQPVLDAQGHIVFHAIGGKTTEESGLSLAAGFAMFRMAAPYMFYKVLEMQKDWDDDNFVSLLAKIWTANFLLLQSREGFWESSMARPFQIFARDPVRLTEWLAEQFGKNIQTQAGRKGLIDAMGEPLQDFIRTKLSPEHQAKLDTWINRGSWAVNPIKHGMDHLRSIANDNNQRSAVQSDQPRTTAKTESSQPAPAPVVEVKDAPVQTPQNGDEKPVNKDSKAPPNAVSKALDAAAKKIDKKAVAKAVVQVYDGWNEACSRLNLFQQEIKAIKKGVQHVREHYGLTDGFKINTEEQVINEPILPANKQLKPILEGVPLPKALDVLVMDNGEVKPINARVTRISIGAAGDAKAKQPVDFVLHTGGPGIPVNRDTVEVELVVSEQFLRSVRASGQPLLVAVKEQLDQVVSSSRNGVFVNPSEVARDMVFLDREEAVRRLQDNGVSVDARARDLLSGTLTPERVRQLLAYLEQSGIKALDAPVLKTFINNGFGKESTAEVAERQMYQEVIWRYFDMITEQPSFVGKEKDLVQEGKLTAAGRADLRSRIEAAVKDGRFILPGAYDKTSGTFNDAMIDKILTDAVGKFERYYHSFDNARSVTAARDQILREPELGEIFKDVTVEKSRLQNQDKKTLSQFFTNPDADILILKSFDVDSDAYKELPEGDKKIIQEALNQPILRAEFIKLDKLMGYEDKRTESETKELTEKIKAMRTKYSAQLAAIETAMKTAQAEGNLARLTALNALFIKTQKGAMANNSQLMFTASEHFGTADRWFNMGTGEGKSITSYLLGLDEVAKGEKVVLVFSDPGLLKKAVEEARPLLEAKGIPFAVFTSEPEQREAMKNHMEKTPVLFALRSSLDFAAAQDGNKVASGQKVMEKFGDRVMIIDEADLIRYENETSPVVISGGSGPTDPHSRFWVQAQDIIERAKNEHLLTFDPATKQIKFKDGFLRFLSQNYPEFADHLNSQQKVDGMQERAKFWNIIRATATVDFNYQRNVHYQIEGKSLVVFDSRDIVLIDEFTGYGKPGQQANEGITQAIQAREGMRITKETASDTVYLPEFTVPRAKRTYNLSGTIVDIARQMMGKGSVGQPIQPYLPSTRVDMPDVVTRDAQAQREIILYNLSQEMIGNAHLICVRSPEEAKALETYLTDHQAELGYKTVQTLTDQDSADAKKGKLEKAGNEKVITIATIAGRGTDIKLGLFDSIVKSANESNQGKSEKAKVGLTVTIADYFADVRIMEQIRGRGNRMDYSSGEAKRGRAMTWVVASLEGTYFKERPEQRNLVEKMFFSGDQKAVMSSRGNVDPKGESSEAQKLDAYIQDLERINGKPFTPEDIDTAREFMHSIYETGQDDYRAGKDNQARVLYENNRAMMHYQSRVIDRLSAITDRDQLIDFLVEYQQRAIDNAREKAGINLNAPVTANSIKQLSTELAGKFFGVNYTGVDMHQFEGKNGYELINALKDKETLRRSLSPKIPANVEEFKARIQDKVAQIKQEASSEVFLKREDVKTILSRSQSGSWKEMFTERLEKYLFDRFSETVMEQTNGIRGVKLASPTQLSVGLQRQEVVLPEGKAEALEAFAKAIPGLSVEVKDQRATLTLDRALTPDQLKQLESIIGSQANPLLSVPENPVHMDQQRVVLEQSLEAALRDLGDPIVGVQRQVELMGKRYTIANPQDVAAINGLLRQHHSDLILVAEWKGDHDAFFLGRCQRVDAAGHPSATGDIFYTEKLTDANGASKEVVVVTVTSEIMNNPNKVLGFTFSDKSNLLGPSRQDNLIIVRPEEIKKQYRDMVLIAFGKTPAPSKESAAAALEFVNANGIMDFKEAGIDPHDEHLDQYDAPKPKAVIAHMTETVLHHERDHQRESPRPEHFSEYRFVKGGRYTHNQGLIETFNELRADFGGRLAAILAAPEQAAPEQAAPEQAAQAQNVKRAELARLAYEAQTFMSETYRGSVQREVAQKYLAAYNGPDRDKALAAFAEAQNKFFQATIKETCSQLDTYYGRRTAEKAIADPAFTASPLPVRIAHIDAEDQAQQRGAEYTAINIAKSALGDYRGTTIPRPEEPSRIVLPGIEAHPNPDARVLTGQELPEPNPDLSIVVPGRHDHAQQDVQVVLPGEVKPSPQQRVMIPGEVTPRPEVSILGLTEANAHPVDPSQLILPPIAPVLTPEEHLAHLQSEIRLHGLESVRSELISRLVSHPEQGTLLLNQLDFGSHAHVRETLFLSAFEQLMALDKANPDRQPLLKQLYDHAGEHKLALINAIAAKPEPEALAQASEFLLHTAMAPQLQPHVDNPQALIAQYRHELAQFPGLPEALVNKTFETFLADTPNADIHRIVDLIKSAKTVQSIYGELEKTGHTSDWKLVLDLLTPIPPTDVDKVKLTLKAVGASHSLLGKGNTLALPELSRLTGISENKLETVINYMKRTGDVAVKNLTVQTVDNPSPVATQPPPPPPPPPVVLPPPIPFGTLAPWNTSFLSTPRPTLATYNGMPVSAIPFVLPAPLPPGTIWSAAPNNAGFGNNWGSSWESTNAVNYSSATINTGPVSPTSPPPPPAPPAQSSATPVAAVVVAAVSLAPGKDAKVDGITVEKTMSDRMVEAKDATFKLVSEQGHWVLKTTGGIAKEVSVKGGIPGAAAETIKVAFDAILTDKRFTASLHPGSEYELTLHDLAGAAGQGFVSWSVFDLKQRFMPIPHSVIVFDTVKALAEAPEAQRGYQTAISATNLGSFMALQTGTEKLAGMVSANPLLKATLPLFVAVVGSEVITRTMDNQFYKDMQKDLNDPTQWRGRQMRGLNTAMGGLSTVLPSNWLVSEAFPMVVAQVGDAQLTKDELAAIPPEKRQEFIQKWILEHQFALQFPKITEKEILEHLADKQMEKIVSVYKNLDAQTMADLRKVALGNARQMYKADPIAAKQSYWYHLERGDIMSAPIDPGDFKRFKDKLGTELAALEKGMATASPDPQKTEQLKQLREQLADDAAMRDSFLSERWTREKLSKGMTLGFKNNLRNQSINILGAFADGMALRGILKLYSGVKGLLPLASKAAEATEAGAAVGMLGTAAKIAKPLVVLDAAITVGNKWAENKDAMRSKDPAKVADAQTRVILSSSGGWMVESLLDLPAVVGLPSQKDKYMAVENAVAGNQTINTALQANNRAVGKGLDWVTTRMHNMSVPTSAAEWSRKTESGTVYWADTGKPEDRLEFVNRFMKNSGIRFTQTLKDVDVTAFCLTLSNMYDHGMTKKIREIQVQGVDKLDYAIMKNLYALMNNGILAKSALTTKDPTILSQLFINPDDDNMILRKDFESTEAYKHLPESDRKLILQNAQNRLSESGTILIKQVSGKIQVEWKPDIKSVNTTGH